jgi:FSR family fosmidomycin resistance protein-like MFS transporter
MRISKATTDNPSTSSQHRRWVVLIMFMAAHAINDGYSWIIPPLLPSIREHFQLSYAETGAFYTFFRFLGDVLQAPAAYLVHFAPISTILVMGLLWSVVGMFIASFSFSYGMLVWVSAFSGIGRATYHPLAVTMISRFFGREALGRAIAFHLSGSSFGHVIGPLLVGMLLARYGWRLPIQVWSVLGILMGVVLFSFLKNQKEVLHATGKAFKLPFLSKSLAIYLGAVGIWGIAQTGVMAFLPLFLVDYRTFTKGNAATLYAMMALASTIARPFLGALMDRMGKRKPVLIGGFLIASFSILSLVILKYPLTNYVSILLLGVFATGHSGLADTLMVEMIPSQRREETLGFIYTVRMGMASLAPLIVGVISEQISLANTFLILAAVPLLTVFLLSRIEEKPVD